MFYVLNAGQQRANLCCFSLLPCVAVHFCKYKQWRVNLIHSPLCGDSGDVLHCPTGPNPV